MKFAPGSYGAWFRFAYFHQQVNRFAQARRGYEKATLLAHQGSKPANVAITLNNLGILSRAKARKQYEEALEIYRQFAQRAPQAYESRVQQVASNL